MRALGKLLLFSFSVLHRLASIVLGAHLFLLRNLFSRHRDAARPRAVKRG